MDVHSSKTMRDSPKYTSHLLDSIMDLLTGNSSNYRWRGRHSSLVDYKTNDVVLYMDNGEPMLYVAIEDNSGIFNPNQWSVYQISIAGATTYASTTFTLTIPCTGWVDDTTYEDFGKKIVLETTGMKDDKVPLVMIYPNFHTVALEAGLCTTVISGDDTLTFFAVEVPSEDIFTSVTVLSDEVCSSYEITIPTVGWVEDNTYSDYAYRIDLSLAYVKAEFIPLIFIHPGSILEAASCGLCSTAISEEMRIRLFSKIIPGNSISASLTLLGDRSYNNKPMSELVEYGAGELITIDDNKVIDVNKEALVRSDVVSTNRAIAEILDNIYGSETNVVLSDNSDSGNSDP